MTAEQEEEEEEEEEEEDEEEEPSWIAFHETQDRLELSNSSFSHSSSSPEG